MDDDASRENLFPEPPETLLRLNDRLRRCGELWAAANDSSLAALGRLAINDSSFFNRIESPRGTTTATLEKFAQFLSDAASWPEGPNGRVVPREVCEFAHVVGISSAACAASPDSADANIGPDPQGATQ